MENSSGVGRFWKEPDWVRVSLKIFKLQWVLKSRGMV